MTKCDFIQYAYSYIAAGSGGGRQLIHTEQQYSGGQWVNDNQLTHKYDAQEEWRAGSPAPPKPVPQKTGRHKTGPYWKRKAGS